MCLNVFLILLNILCLTTILHFIVFVWVKFQKKLSVLQFLINKTFTGWMYHIENFYEQDIPYRIGIRDRLI